MYCWFHADRNALATEGEFTHLTHDDSAINGQLQVLQGSPHNGEDTLHSVNLLTQEDVHGGQRTHFLQPCLHLGARMV